MASTFTNAATALSTTSRTDLYTSPALTTAVIHSLFVANVNGSTPANATIEFYNSANSTYYPLAYLTPVPGGSTLIFDKPINLKAGDKLSITASAANILTAYASVMQIS